MRTFGYWLGVGLLIAGAAAALADLATIAQGAALTFSPGAIWLRLHANSLAGFQALIEKGALAWLWPPIQFVLTLPTWWLLVPPGLILVFACRAGSRV